MVSLRSVDLGRLRFEAVELTNRGRLSVLSMETLRWVFTVSALTLSCCIHDTSRGLVMLTVLKLERKYPQRLCAIAQGFDGGKEHHFLFRYWPWRHLRRLCRGSGGLTSFAFGFALLLLMMCLPCGRGDYGLWTAFLVFPVRLFYSIPGELELPLLFLLLVIISPYQALNLRGTQAGMVISIAVAFQHFSRAGGLKKALDQETVSWMWQ